LTAVRSIPSAAAEVANSRSLSRTGAACGCYHDLSGVPQYLQVARIIEAEIRSGQWTPGNAVPSRNQLAERFGIARETAARAHAWLQPKRVTLVAVPGVGMVVTPTSRWPK
jgi:DNA-binding GntR family transcriptional regulator